MRAQEKGSGRAFARKTGSLLVAFQAEGKATDEWNALCQTAKGGGGWESIGVERKGCTGTLGNAREIQSPV